MIIIIIN